MPKRGRRASSAADQRGRLALREILHKTGGIEARTTQMLGPARPPIVGVFYRSREGGKVVPADRRNRNEYRVAERDTGGTEDGELVRVEELSTSRLSLPRARIVERLGPSSDPGAISLLAIASCEIPTEFSLAAIAEAEAAPSASSAGRSDLRDVALVTIDGADARDFDDAVWAEPDPDPENRGGWHIIVAIADVAWYVRPGTALDREARRRGRAQTAFHTAAPALHRGEPRQEARRARHRPPFDLRVDPAGPAGSFLRPARATPLPAGGSRAARHRVFDKLFRALRRIHLHRRSREPARRRVGRSHRLEGGAAQFLAGFFDRGRRHQGADHQPGAGRARRGAWATFFSGRRHRARSTPLPGLRRRQAQHQARQIWRIHRVFRLPELPLHPGFCARGRGGRRYFCRRSARNRSGERLGDYPQEGSLRPLYPARRRQRRAQTEAGRLAAIDKAGRCRPRHGAATARLTA